MGIRLLALIAVTALLVAMGWPVEPLPQQHIHLHQRPQTRRPLHQGLAAACRPSAVRPLPVKTLPNPVPSA